MAVATASPICKAWSGRVSETIRGYGKPVLGSRPEKPVAGSGLQ